MTYRRRAAALLAGVSLTALAACTSSASTSDPADGRTISVTSSSDACDLSTDTAPSGRLVFTIENVGQDVTEFYLYAADGKRVVAEMENIGPGLSRTLVLKADAATYVATCKPGMKDTGIRSTFTVTPSDAPDQAAGAAQQQLAPADVASP